MSYAVFDNFLDAVVVIDRNLRVWYANVAAGALFEVSIRRLRDGKVLSEIATFDPELFEDVSELWAIKEASPYREVHFDSMSGKSGDVRVSFQLDRGSDGNDPMWIMYVRDVTLERQLQDKYLAELQHKDDLIVDLRSAQMQLEDYSKNLEKKVQERTLELENLNNLLKAMINSLSEGFFIFNRSGICLSTYSKACERLLEGSPARQNISDVLRIPIEEKATFYDWCKTLFAEPLPFEDLVPLGPSKFCHSENKQIRLEYHPMRLVDDSVSAVVVVVKDETAEFEAKQEAERERSFARRIVRLAKNKRHFLTFLNDAKKIVASAVAELDLFLSSDSRSEGFGLESLFRAAHTLKGGAATFDLDEVVALCHRCEEQLATLKNQGPQSKVEPVSQLRSDFLQVNSLLRSFVHGNRDILGVEFEDGEKTVSVDSHALMQFCAEVKELDPSLRIYQRSLNLFFREPIERFIREFESAISELAQKLGKRVSSMRVVGGNLMIFPTPYEEFFSSLIHLFRNIVDHGIETPEVREKLGKSPEGHVEVAISLFGKGLKRQIRIEIEDDGAGVDPKRVKEKLKSQGNLACETESEHQLIQHVFDSHFSTRGEVTQISGRGIGMDAIKVAVNKLGGTVEIFSTVQKGTRLVVELPYLEWEPAREQAA